MPKFLENLYQGGGGGSNILRYPYEALSSVTDYLQIDILEYVPVSKNSQNTSGTGSLISSPGSRRNSLNNRVGYRSIGGLTNRVLKDTGTILKGFSLMEQNMPDEVNAQLRAAGVITENEVALRAGDIYLAYDVVTKNRRRINATHEILTESSKRLLRG